MKGNLNGVNEEKNERLISVEETAKSEENLLEELLSKKFQILQRTSVKKRCQHFQVLSQV